MTLGELTSMTNRIVEEDRRDPESYRPIVAIGHTKDLIDPETVENFLSFLKSIDVAVSTFKDIYPRLLKGIETINRAPLDLGAGTQPV